MEGVSRLYRGLFETHGGLRHMNFRATIPRPLFTLQVQRTAFPQLGVLPELSSKYRRRPKYMGHMPLTSRTIKSNARLSRPSVSGTRFEAHTRYFTVHVTDQPRQ